MVFFKIPSDICTMKPLSCLLPFVAFCMSSCVVMENAATSLKPVGRGIRDGLTEVGQQSRKGVAWIESRVQERSKQRQTTPRRTFTPAPPSVWSSSSSSDARSRSQLASNRPSTTNNSQRTVSVPKPPVSKPAPTSWNQGSVGGSKSSPPKQSMGPQRETSAPVNDQFKNLPFAVAVPGKSGFVTLPNRNLPDIDVQGIAPGTPVEIQDPERTGETIQFKVP